jgi:hypothetical protein
MGAPVAMNVLMVVALVLTLPSAVSAVVPRPMPLAGLPRFHVHGDEGGRARVFRTLPHPLAPVAPPAPARIRSPAMPDSEEYFIGDELPATAANAQRYVALAHRAMRTCLDRDAAASRYGAAVSALHVQRYRVAMASSRDVVDDCAGH